MEIIGYNVEGTGKTLCAVKHNARIIGGCVFSHRIEFKYSFFGHDKINGRSASIKRPYYTAKVDEGVITTPDLKTFTLLRTGRKIGEVIKQSELFNHINLF